MIFSEEGMGKSLLAYDLAFAVATGQDFLGLHTHQGKVLYFDEENSRAFAQERVWGLAKARSILTLAPGLFQLWLGSLIGHWGVALSAEVAKEKPALVVIDTFSALLPAKAGAENDNALMKGLLMVLRRAVLRVSPLTTLLMLHHDTKSPLTMGKPRGASAIAGDVDGSFRLGMAPAKGGPPDRLLIPGKIRVISVKPPAIRVHLETWTDGAMRVDGELHFEKKKLA